MGIQGQRAYGHYTQNSLGLTLTYDSLGEGVFYLGKLLKDMAPTYCDRRETVKIGEWTHACKEYFEGSFELGVEFGPYTFDLRTNNVLFFPEFGDGISETYKRVK